MYGKETGWEFNPKERKRQTIVQHIFNTPSSTPGTKFKQAKMSVKIHPFINAKLNYLNRNNNVSNWSVFVPSKFEDKKQIFLFYSLENPENPSLHYLTHENGSEKDIQFTTNNITDKFKDKIKNVHFIRSSEKDSKITNAIIQYEDFSFKVFTVSLNLDKPNESQFTEILTISSESQKFNPIIDIRWCPRNLSLDEDETILLLAFQNGNIGYFKVDSNTNLLQIDSEQIFVGGQISCIAYDPTDSNPWSKFNVIVATGNTISAVAPIAPFTSDTQYEEEDANELAEYLEFGKEVMFLNLNATLGLSFLPIQFPYPEEFEANIISMQLFHQNLFVLLENGKAIHFKCPVLVYGESSHDLELIKLEEKVFEKATALTLIQNVVYVCIGNKIQPFDGDFMPEVNDLKRPSDKEKLEVLKAKKEFLQKKENELKERRQKLENMTLPDIENLSKMFSELNEKSEKSKEMYQELESIYITLSQIENEIK